MLWRKAPSSPPAWIQLQVFLLLVLLAHADPPLTQNRYKQANKWVADCWDSQQDASKGSFQMISFLHLLFVTRIYSKSIF